jgi:hypothetical protein
MTEEKEIVKVKTADKPHYVSIILSIAAVIISCFSWWESHSSRLINESSNRALVHVVSLKPVKNPDLSGTTYLLVVKNFGKSNALNVGFSYAVSTVDPDNSDENSSLGSVLAWDQWDLPPNMEREDSIGFIPKDLKANTLVYFKGAMLYKDEATGKDFVQRWCFTFIKSQEDNIHTCPP